LLTEKQKQGFLPLYPDFVIELRSFSDRLITLKDKMSEYMDNGTQLGWLIDPQNRQVSVWQPGEKSICLDNPEIISGEPLLPGFILNVSEIWELRF